MVGVSVVICCYNSSARIEETLNHLAKQNIVDVPWEILIIDNNSSDNIEAVVTEIWNNLNTSIKLSVHKEYNPGLQNAREKGFQESNYEYILFCDDDNWLCEDYIQIGFNILIQNTSIGMLGGIGEPVFSNISEPYWFKDFSNTYAVGPQYQSDGDITKEVGYVYGAGSFIKKSLYLKLKELGCNFIITGRKGKELLSGDDNELGYCISLLGAIIWYSTELKFYHFIPTSRLNLDYVYRQRKGAGKSSILFIPYHKYRYGKFGVPYEDKSYVSLLLFEALHILNNVIKSIFSNKRMKLVRKMANAVHLGRLEGLISYRKTIQSGDQLLNWINK